MLGKRFKFVILLILYTDSKLLYNYLVKQNTTQKKIRSRCDKLMSAVLTKWD